MPIHKHFLAFLGISLALIMVSCGQAQTGNSVASNTASGNEASPVKSEEEIIQDLSEREDFFSLFDYNYYVVSPGSSYKIDELTITRRKIDETAGTDHVYAAITASSPEGKYTGNFHLLYSFYDVGGWYLESIELESGNLEANSGIPEAKAFNLALEELYTLGADVEDCWIEDTNTDGQSGTATVAVDFADDVIKVNGALVLHFDFDGTDWGYIESDYNLNSELLIEGTYQCTDCLAQPQYLTVTHENGNLLIYHAHSWDGGIDPFHLQEGLLDGITRSYYAVSGEFTHTYYFGPDGIISYSLNGMPTGTFHRIATPTTDSKALWDAVRKAGIAYK